MFQTLAIVLLVFVTQVAYALETPVMRVGLPFPAGVSYRCTQNSDDYPSHGRYKDPPHNRVPAPSTSRDVDFKMKVGDIVAAAADGRVVHGKNPGGFGNYVRLEHSNGYWTMYGHLSSYIAKDGDMVVAGQPIAYSGNTGFVRPVPTASSPNLGEHLHFGVHKGDGVGVSYTMEAYGHDSTAAESGWFSTGPLGESEFSCDPGGHYYQSAHSAKTTCRFIGTKKLLCWDSNSVDCQDGSNHVSYYEDSEGAKQSESVKRDLCVQQLGEVGNALTYLEGGYGVGGVGPGGIPATTGTPVLTYPDFIPTNVDILTTGGLETYVYGNLETHKVKAQFANVGDRDADSRPIEVHTYRSKGYKEDQHGDWVHVATNTIQGQNLKKDATHTETATISLNGLLPGIYNYVSCIDHPKTEQNNGGDHQEKHESNNCSTEAVFEVKAGVVNQPNVDLTISQVALSTNPVYANYPMSASLWVRNTGTETPTATSRAAYYVSGPGTSNQWKLIADDEVLASELTPGRDQGESIKSPVPAPSIPGSYQLMACADYLNQVLETNKANNCLVIPFTIQTLPAPVLSITKFQDEESCCTTNTGSRIKPNIWVKNSGPVAPATNVQVLYQVSSPVATGNQWVYIGYGIIEPRELPPGKTDEDYMEGSGFTIPSSNAWKLQWHQVRACIKPDGSAPSGDTAQGDICATYQRYSKK